MENTGLPVMKVFEHLMEGAHFGLPPFVFTDFWQTSLWQEEEEGKTIVNPFLVGSVVHTLTYSHTNMHAHSPSFDLNFKICETSGQCTLCRERNGLAISSCCQETMAMDANQEEHWSDSVVVTQLDDCRVIRPLGLKRPQLLSILLNLYCLWTACCW